MILYRARFATVHVPDAHGIIERREQGSLDRLRRAVRQDRLGMCGGGLEDAADDADLPLTEDERAVIDKLEERLLRRTGPNTPKTDEDNPDDDGEGS